MRTSGLEASVTSVLWMANVQMVRSQIPHAKAANVKTSGLGHFAVNALSIAPMLDRQMTPALRASANYIGLERPAKHVASKTSATMV